MSDRIDLSVIIPSYSEEENLRILLPRLIKELGGLGAHFEILVVDTTSPMDHTASVCQDHGARYMPRENGNTYGDAVRTGIANTLGDFVLFMDADGSHSPEFIRSMWQTRETADVVVASRYIAGGSTENPRILIVMSQILNGMYRFTLNIKCRDVSNSFKLFRGHLLRQIELTCNNFDVVEEILVRCSIVKPDLSIKEIPFVFKKRMFGMSKRALVTFIFSFYVTLFRLLLIKLSQKLGRRHASR